MSNGKQKDKAEVMRTKGARQLMASDTNAFSGALSGDRQALNQLFSLRYILVYEVKSSLRGLLSKLSL